MPEEEPLPGDIMGPANHSNREDVSSVVGGVDLEAVEAAVQSALRAPPDPRLASGLTVLGYGEISLVIGWPGDEPKVACKRLPVFDSDRAASRYHRRFEDYLRILTERGVTPVHSQFRTLDADGGSVVGYVVQPVLPTSILGPEVLRATRPDPAHPLLRTVVDAVTGVLDERTGLDAQISNWSHDEGGLRYLDVTTPMCFDETGRMDLDMDLFLAAYPWALRYFIGRFVAPGVVAAYRDPRHVLVDMTANLIKERLSHWIPAALEVLNGTLTPAVTRDEVQRYYRSDARLWEVMLQLRRADRWWQRNVRRREYPFLLPGHINR